MSFAKRMQGVADKLLTKFDERPAGSRMQLIQQGAAVWDDVLVEMVFPAPVTTEVIGVAVPYSQNLVDGTTIQSGDIKVTITSDVEPMAADKMSIDGVQYSVISILPYAYTGKDLTMAYAVQLRR